MLDADEYRKVIAITRTATRLVDLFSYQEAASPKPPRPADPDPRTERAPMSFFSRRIPYDRKRLLELADSLREGRRWRKALRLYRQILAAEPRNGEIHLRVAPLLARAGKDFEAWESFRIAADALERAGEEEAVLALYEQARKALPRSFDAYRALARAELIRQHPEQALRTLVQGSQQLRRRAPRGPALPLLRDAREIEPWNGRVVIDLSRLLAREGQPAEALFLLDHLDDRASGEHRLAGRALAWRIEPSLRHSWRYLRLRWGRTRSLPARPLHGRG